MLAILDFFLLADPQQHILQRILTLNWRCKNLNGKFLMKAIFSLYIGTLLGTSICWCGKLFIHFFHHFMRSSSSLWSQDSFRSHTSLYMSSASSVTGEMMPTGLYIDAKNFSIPLFAASWSGTWKFTSNVSLTLFHDTPNIFNSDVLVFNSCLPKSISAEFSAVRT